MLIAMVLIIAIASGAVFSWYQKRYAYSNERADLSGYFKASGDERAIVLGNEILEDKALFKDGACYLEYSLVKKYLNDLFYLDAAENILIYTDPYEEYRTTIGSGVYTRSGSENTLPFTICYKEGEEYFLALDYVKLFANFEYEVYDHHIRLVNEWAPYESATVTKNTQVRVKGGIKSPILRDVEEGETVAVLEQLENWSKIKTRDAFIGYVENKKLSDISETSPTPVMNYVEPEAAGVPLNQKVCLGWHSIGGVGGNVTLDSMVAGTKGMNVIAPTWFSMNDNAGGFRSFGEVSYVERAHELGLKVWGVFDNFNYGNETGTDIDELAVLSSTTTRHRMIEQLISTAKELKLDGINLDFEQLSSECGKHYVQFVKELSLECHKNGLTISVDNYMPNEGNRFYRMDVQGKFADYVILMGYDEHWHGCKNPGSVASIGFVSEGITKTLSWVPSKKLVNALPFYTIVWAVDGAEVTDEYLTMNNLAEFLSAHPEEKVWNEETCQYYMEWTSGSKDFSVWLEDAESIRVKLNVMETNDLAGVAVWRLGFGTEAAWDLIQMYTGSSY